MKSSKLVYLAMTAALALVTYSVKGAPAPTTTEYSTLTFALAGQMQALNETNISGDIYLTTSTAFRITNKDILDLMAKWAGVTNWPAGAQLIYDWSGEPGEVCVADRTGTNILLYCGEGYWNGGIYAYVSLDWYYEGGFYTFEQYLDDMPGYNVYTYVSQAYLNLYYDDEGGGGDYAFEIPAGSYIDLETYGSNTENGNEVWNLLTETDVYVDTFLLNGGYGSFMNEDAVFGGVIKGVEVRTYPVRSLK
jgi:hypothetical protein